MRFFGQRPDNEVVNTPAFCSVFIQKWGMNPIFSPKNGHIMHRYPG
jgi:hypothetical protein